MALVALEMAADDTKEGQVVLVGPRIINEDTGDRIMVN
jgi:hypothetical protein